ncbi:MAG: hypothetical protein QY323_01040 [Patescibacteria group bacterium]|nr:MAG: hypothetical protein QY323_01040 [Patescibacteria group bacterium]
MHPTAEDRLAAECQTTVITCARQAHAWAPSIGALIKKTGRDGRFDLLTALDFPHLAGNKEVLTQAVEDAMLALSLHKGEQILVVGGANVEQIVAAVREQFHVSRKVFPNPISEDVPINSIDMGPVPMPDARCRTLAITCMDFRQHDNDLATKLAMQLGLDEAPHILAMAGGAKDVEGTMRRSRLTLAQINDYRERHDLRTIVITCHTDCGAFGGSQMFENTAHEDAQFDYRLRVARGVLRRRFSGVAIIPAIVRLADGRIGTIERRDP